MLLFGVTIPATVPQGSEIPEGLMNKPVYMVYCTVVVVGSVSESGKVALRVRYKGSCLHLVGSSILLYLYLSSYGV